MAAEGFSRRALMRRFLAGVAATAGAPARGQSPEPADRGIGGTGAAPTSPGGEDRGIGGTGVIGTIRRFGSIYVNGLRIRYPADVRVTIDGEAADASRLRIGQVVQVLARRTGGRLATRSIAVLHEAVGPVEAAADGTLRVLHQDIAPVPGVWPAGWRAGDRVAVSGLRRPDGVVVPSLVERASGERIAIAGTVASHPDGRQRIGALRIEGLAPVYAGRRLVVGGRLDGDSLVVAEFYEPEAALLAQSPDRVSIEAFVERDGHVVTLPGGLQASSLLATSIPETQPVRAVVSARLAPDGSLNLTSVAVDRGSRGPSGPAGHSAAPDRPGNAGPGFGPGSNEGGPPHGSGPAGGGGRDPARGIGAPGGPGAPGSSGGPGGPGGPGGGRGGPH